MAIEYYEVHTVTCDIPNCTQRRTANSIETLREEGWSRLEIFDSQFEVCPDHEVDLREFFLDSRKGKN